MIEFLLKIAATCFGVMIISLFSVWGSKSKARIIIWLDRLGEFCLYATVFTLVLTGILVIWTW